MQTCRTLTKYQTTEFNKIADFVLDKLGCDVRLNTGSRKRELVYSRALFFVIAHQKFRFSYERTASFLNKDHSTFIHATKLWKEHLKDDYKEYFYEYFPKLDKRKLMNESIHKDTGLPVFIVNHLLKYSEKELKDLYKTRLVPYKKMLDNENNKNNNRKASHYKSFKDA